MPTYTAPTKDLRLWDIGTQREICKLTQPSMVRDTRFTADGKRLLVSAGLTQLWEIASGKRLWTKGNSVETLAISHDNKLVAGGSHYGEVIIWELDTGKEITRYNGHEGRITAVAFTADNRRVVSAGTMGTVRVWQLP